MKPARGPQTMFFGNDCCGIIVLQIQMGAGRVHSDRRSAWNGCHGVLLERRSGAAQGLPTMKGQAKCAKGNFF